jgi:hypothetical protein
VTDFFLLFNFNPFPMLHLRIAHPAKDAHPAWPELLGERASRVEGFFSDDFFPLQFSLSRFFSYSSALFCANQKLNPFIFKQFRTLWQKHGGWGSAQPYLMYGSNFKVHQ